jgi:hypothetical protein
MAMSKEERVEYNKQWRMMHPEKSVEYYENRKERGQTGYDPEYYAANIEEFKQRQYKSNEKHKEKRTAYLKEYYQKNKEKMILQQKIRNWNKDIEELEQKIIDYPAETNFYKAEIIRIKKQIKENE